MTHEQVKVQDMPAGVVLLLFWYLVRFNCARNSRFDNLSCLQGCDHGGPESLITNIACIMFH